MDRQRMMAATKTQSYCWWFDSHNTNPARSEWLNSTLSALDDKTKAMLRIIEEDADSFSQRAEMYYKKRPQLVGMVEDFYRAHRSLAEQFDHLRHEPGSRRLNPLAHSFSHSMGQPEKKIDPHKSYDSSFFTKFAYDKEDLFTPLSNGSPEKSLDPVKPYAGRYTNLAYDSDESLDSEVEDPVDYDEAEDSEEEISSVERLSEQLMVKDQTIEELKLKLSESATIATQLMEEAERLRVEKVEMARKFKEEKEELIAEKQKEAREAMKKKAEEKDEEKREAIRQLSSAIDMMKDENRMIKKTLVDEANKRWKPFESSQVLKGFGKLLNCSILSSQPSVVPL